jgi:hypothetical protein
MNGLSHSKLQGSMDKDYRTCHSGFTGTFQKKDCRRAAMTTTIPMPLGSIEEFFD